MRSRRQHGRTAARQRYPGCRQSSSLPFYRSAVLPLLLAACGPPDRAADTQELPDSGYAMQRVAGGALVLPDGFRIDVYAERIDGIRFLALGPDGAVYATRSGHGTVIRLPDRNRDGRADEVVQVAQGLRNPSGITFHGDVLYVAEEHQVIRFRPPYAQHDVLVHGLPADGGHSTRTVRVRGDHLYVSIGSSCNLCDERDPRRAAIVRYDLDGLGETIYASGLRNSVGLVVHPETGDLWATNNDRDRLGDDRPPDRINLIREHGWYGWPQCYLPGTPNPEYRRDAHLCDNAIGPVVTLPAHSAPLGIAFYTGTRFPDSMRGDAFVALHGSWDRSFPIGYEVVRVPVRDGRPTGAWRHFIAGWQVGRRWWGRPVDVLVLPDGSMLLSDDFGGRVYRVWYEG